MSRTKITIKGSQEAKKSLRQLPVRAGDALKKEGDTQLQFLARRAAANAPIDKGDLRGAIESSIEKHGTIIEGEIICDVPYALEMHEGDYPLGEKSALEPGTPEGGVGRKFIERAIQHNSLAVDKELGKSQLDMLKKMEGEVKK